MTRSPLTWWWLRISHRRRSSWSREMRSLGLISLTAAISDALQGDRKLMSGCRRSQYPPILQCAVVMKKSETEGGGACLSGLAALADGAGELVPKYGTGRGESSTWVRWSSTECIDWRCMDLEALWLTLRLAASDDRDSAGGGAAARVVDRIGARICASDGAGGGGVATCACRRRCWGFICWSCWGR